ncbi:MAG: putative membrane protein YfcA [Myxococcota bacterium]|jgi:uncharacterized membrane protein YfcA
MSLLLLGAILILAYAVQTAAGFGATVLAVTIGSFFMPIEELVPLLVPLSLAQTLWIGWRHRKQVDTGYLLGRILPLMGAGMLVGFYALSDLGGSNLKLAFALMILVLSVQELVAMRRGTAAGAGSAVTEIVALLGAGVVHGIFATGGPLLVYAASRRAMDKGTFRSTLIVVWLPLNAVLCTQLIVAERLTTAQAPTVGLLLLTLPLGVWLGERIHDRVDETRFRKMVFTLLFVAALISLGGVLAG